MEAVLNPIIIHARQVIVDNMHVISYVNTSSDDTSGDEKRSPSSAECCHLFDE